MSSKGSAKYYVVYEDDEWKVLISEPYTESSGNTVLRTFGSDYREADAYADKLAKKNDEQAQHNYKSGATGRYYYDPSES